jgi:hypothetical protein
VGDIYLFAEIDRCMIPDCECSMRPWRGEFQASDGKVILWLCPCHVLQTLDAVMEMQIKDAGTGEWRVVK